MNPRYALLAILCLMGSVRAQSPPVGSVRVETSRESDRLAIGVVWETAGAIEVPMAMAIPESDRDRPRQRVELAPARSRATATGFEHRATLRVSGEGENWLVRVGDGTAFGAWIAVGGAPAERAAETPPAEPNRVRYLTIAAALLAVGWFVALEVRHRRRLRGVRTR